MSNEWWLPEILRARRANLPSLEPITQSRRVQANRVGKAPVTGFFSHEVKRHLRILAATKQTTIQQILSEALSDYFVKNGLPELDRLELRADDGGTD
jgi:hypothetical protein